MGKLFLLPFGYNINDASFGTYTYVTDVGDYEQYRGEDISMDDASDVFFGLPGIISIEEMFEQIQLNQWAAFKPTKNPSFPSGMKVVSNEIIWDKPSSQDDYRLGDFVGYNNTATSANVNPTSDSFNYVSLVGGVETRSVTIIFPEYDIRNDVENLTTATHIRLQSQKWDSLNSIWVDDRLTTSTITNSAISNKSLSVNYELNHGGTFDFRVLIYVGTSGSNLASYYDFTITGTATSGRSI